MELSDSKNIIEEELVILTENVSYSYYGSL